GGSVAADALRQGVPAVTLECGGGTFTPQHQRDYTAAIANCLKALEMLPGDAPTQSRYTIISGGAFLFSREGGLFVQECPLGSIQPKGGLIGRQIDLYGDTVEEIRCPSDNAYIAALRLNYFPTYPGDIVSEAIPVESFESG